MRPDRGIPRWLAVAVGFCAVLALPALRLGLIGLGLPGIAALLTFSAAGMQAAVYSLLAIAFALSLLPDRVPLVTRMARMVRGELPAELLLYTRHVTLAWCCFCLAQMACSVLLFAFAPREAWSFFVTVLNLPFLALMFMGEYVYRLIRFRHIRHESPAEMMRILRSFRGMLREP